VKQKSQSSIPQEKGSWQRKCRYWYLKLVRQQGHPSEISRGWACGVFAGCFPFLGMQTVFGVLLAILFRGNKFTAAAGTWISNPFTSIPIYLFNFQVGKMILRQDQLSSQSFNTGSWTNLGETGLLFIFTFLFGCTVVGLILGIFAYFLSLNITYRWQKLRKRRGWKRLQQRRDRHSN
jgi:uncharacterized protein (DUF2062 family)